jgi:hypothetical protein
MSMERRGFLKGLFGGVTAAGLIVRANPSDLEAFASPLVKDAPMLVAPPVAEIPELGERLYNADGVCVAIVKRVTVTREQIEATTWGSDQKVYVPGLMSWDIQAAGVGPLRMSGLIVPR